MVSWTREEAWASEEGYGVMGECWLPEAEDWASEGEGEGEACALV